MKQDDLWKYLMGEISADKLFQGMRQRIWKVKLPKTKEQIEDERGYKFKLQNNEK